MGKENKRVEIQLEQWLSSSGLLWYVMGLLRTWVKEWILRARICNSMIKRNERGMITLCRFLRACLENKKNVCRWLPVPNQFQKSLSRGDFALYSTNWQLCFQDRLHQIPMPPESFSFDNNEGDKMQKGQMRIENRRGFQDCKRNGGGIF